MPLLEVENLSVTYRLDRGHFPALKGISFRLEAGQTLGLIGESGSGKSTLALSLLNLLSPRGDMSAARLRFQGQDLLSLNESQWQEIRGHRISLVFQDPMNSLNPVWSLGSQMGAILKRHEPELTGSQREDRLRLMMQRVGLGELAKGLGTYPHELSGGQRQRFLIAMALICGPQLLIADEPTSSLDLITQMQILDLLLDLQKESGLTLLMITHDLGVIHKMCKHVAVMEKGQLVEQTQVEQLFRSPQHPETKRLLAAARARSL